jgi:hypothetical protein
LSDVNANIGINFDTQQALASLRQLQAGLSRFNQSLTQGNVAAANAQKGLNAQLMQAINATGKFSASQRSVATSTTAFTNALEKNQLSMREYFRYTAAAATSNSKVFSRMFQNERDIFNRARKDRVKALQTQYVQLTNAQGDLVKVLQVVPKHLEMANGKYTDYATRVQMAAQRQQLMNQLLKQGSTQLLNFGKNTQWAGRQLMVGLTVPLTMLGTVAAQTFRDMENAVVKFTRVYGDMTTSNDATNKAVADIQRLGKEFTKYGVAAKDTMEMAASAAAMGLTGSDLTAQVSAATKLAVLGQVEQQQALETTISLQNAFGISSDQLAKKINFLNAVENQTVLSIEDLTIAIPKAGPVVQQLGGSVEDLAFFMTAMKEGGINASEGANALKSGLASMINPTKKVSEMLAGFGINIKGIVEANAGNLKNTVIGFAQALDTLDPLNRARAIEQLFGKFQFARLSTLFQNVTKDGSQAGRALQLAGASVEELAILSERELGKVENAVGVKFQKTIEELKIQLIPVGKAFLQALTPVVEFIGKILERFNNFGDGTKKAIAIVIGVLGGIAPVALMTFGLLANGLANLIKFFAMLRGGMAKLNGQNQVLGGGFDYLTQQEIENLAQSNALHTSHQNLISTFNVEAGSVNALALAYRNASSQAMALASSTPGLFNAAPGPVGATAKLPKKYSKGILSVPGKGNKDTVPAMLTPGETVVPVEQSEKHRALLGAIMADKIPGHQDGLFPEGKAPGYIQKEYQRIEDLKPTQLIAYAKQVGIETTNVTTEVLDNIRRVISTEFEQILQDVKTQFGKITKEGLEAVGKKYDPETQTTRMGKYAPKFNEPYGPSFAHVGDTEKISQTQAGQLDIKPEIKRQMDIVKKYYEEQGRQAPDVRVADAFGFNAKQYINRGMASEDQSGFMAKHGESVGTAFERDFAKTGAEKWKTMTDIVGKDFDKIRAQAEIYDKALLEKITAWNTANNNKQIPDPFTDDVFRNLEVSVREDIGSLIPEFSQVIETAKTQITALRTSISEKDLAPINARLKAEGAGSIGTEASNAKYGNIEARKKSEVLGTISSGAELGDAAITGVRSKAGTDAESPSKKAKSAGKEVGDGLVAGMEEAKAEVQSQAAQLGDAATVELNAKTTGAQQDVIVSEGKKQKKALKKTTTALVDVKDSTTDTSVAVDSNLDNLTTQNTLNAGIASTEQQRAQATQESLIKSQQISDAQDSQIAAINNATNAINSGSYDGSQTDFMGPKPGDEGFIGPLTKKQTRQQKKLAASQRRSERGMAVGKYSSKVSGGLGTAAMVAGMAGAPPQVTGALGGAAMVAQFAPMLASLSGPQGIAVAAVAAAGGLYLLNKNAEQAAKKQTELANATQATVAKMKSIGEITGKVGASEIMGRRRQEARSDKFTTGYDRKGSQFGTTFLQSDVGKQLMEGYKTNLKDNAKTANDKMALELAKYVSDGVMTGFEAADVARQLGIEFGNVTIESKINAKLNTLIGPNGENLVTDPLNVRVNLIKEQQGMAADMAGLLTDQLTYGDDNKMDTKAGRNTAALGAATGVNNLAAAQAQLDSYNLQMETKIKELQAQKAMTTDKAKQLAIETQIDTLQKQQLAGAATLRAKAKDSIADQLKLFKIAQQNASVEDGFFDSLKESVRLKYKGTAQEAFVTPLLEKTADLKDKQLEVKINTMVASGQIDPVTMTSMLSKFSDEKELNKQLNIGMSTHGADKFLLMIQNLGIVENEEVNKDLTVKINAMKGKEFDDINATLAQLATIDGKDFNVNLWLGKDSDKALVKLQNLTKKLNRIEKLPDPITKNIIVDTLDSSGDPVMKGAMAGVIANWKYFGALPDEIRKTAIQTYVSEYIVVDPKRVATYQAKNPGVSAEQARQALAFQGTKPQYSTTPPPPKKPGPGDSDGGKGTDPLSFMDDLAMRLKNVRDGAFNANKPLQSLLAAFNTPKAKKDASAMFSIFDGLQQRLLKLGAPKEFRDMIAGMSAKDFEALKNLKGDKAIFTFGKDKKGKVNKNDITGFTKTGKAYMQGLREAALGDFNVVQKETVQNAADQKKAMNMLIASGMSAKDALAVVEDQAVATAIAAGTVGKKGSAEMNKFVGDINAANDALEAQAVLQNLTQKNADFQFAKKAADFATSFKAAGLSVEQINEVLSDPQLTNQLVKDLADGKIDAAYIKEYLDSIPARIVVEMKTAFNSGDLAKAAAPGLEMVDKAFAIKEALLRAEAAPVISKLESQVRAAQDELSNFQRTQTVREGLKGVAGAKGVDLGSQKMNYQDLQDAAKAMQDEINTVQRDLEVNADYGSRVVDKLNEDINDFNRTLEMNPDWGSRAVQKLQDESSILSHDLDVMNRAADEVNKRYDKQAEALQKVSDINANILEQQQGQLDLADAITQGDIAAAARAAQGIRSTAASQFATGQMDALEQARTNALGSLTNKQGMTKDQIEARQYDIAQKIYAMENDPARLAMQKQIQTIQDNIYNIEEKREAILLKIRDKEDSIYKINQELAKDDGVMDKINRRIDDYNFKLGQAQAKLDEQIRSLTVFGKDKNGWDLIKAKFDAYSFQLDSQAMKDKMKFLFDSISLVNGEWSKIQEWLDDFMATDSTKIVTIKTVYETSGAPGGGAGGGGGGGGSPQNQGNIDVVNKQVADDQQKLLDAIKTGTKTNVTPSSIANDMATKLLADKAATEALGGVSGVLSSARYTGQGLQYAAQEAAKAKAAEEAAARAVALENLKKSEAATKATKIMMFEDSYYRSKGGLIPKYFAKGGMAIGTDTVPAMLTPGEFIMSKYAVQSHGIDKLRAMNNGTSAGDSVYNYSLTVNAKSDANPDDIARTVMAQIKQIDSQRIRGVRL